MHPISRIILLFWLLSASLVLAAPSPSSQDLQEAFLRSFHTQLLDVEEAAPEPQTAPTESFLPVRQLLPPPPERLLFLNQSTWMLTALTGTLSLICGFALLLRAWHKYRHAPRQRQLRQARQDLRHCLQQNLPMEHLLPPTRILLDLPPRASLEELAQAARSQGLNSLADACQQTNLNRFQGPDSDPTRLRKALTKLVTFSVLLLLVLAANFYRPQWEEARLLASQGKLRPALQHFLDLHKTGPQSPQLSQNIATLTALTSLPHTAPRDAWLLHAQLQQQATQVFLSPDYILPLLPPCLLLCISAACRRRKGSLLLTGTILALLVGVFLHGLSPRMALTTQAVAPAHLALYAAPESQSHPLLILKHPTQVQLNTELPDVQGRHFITAGTVSGWCDSQDLLTFH